MNYYELVANEKDFYNKLSDNERRVYTSNQKQLAAIAAAWNDSSIRSFVDIARILNELHRTHYRYNNLMELYDNDFVKENDLEQMFEETFNMSLAIGSFSAVISLSCMNNTDALYDYLAIVKMNQFIAMCDAFDVSVLCETLDYYD